MSAAREKLQQVDGRLASAKQAHRQAQQEERAAAEAEAGAEEALVSVEAQRAAGQVDAREVEKARKAAAGVRSGQDWGRLTEIASRAVDLIQQERLTLISDNFRELDGELQSGQAELDRQAEEHLAAALDCISGIHQVNGERSALRQSTGRDTRDVPRYDKWDDLRRLGRHRAQAAA